ncbi:MAG: hypothetical protein GY846_22355 [Deltaproteobacteria bacterium]|nr:hypothetical protein [Deltaproteobacteria bacterium]
MEMYRDIFEFAASAGALEGYVFKKDHLAPSELDDWVWNLMKQYEGFPGEIRENFQGSLDRTLGRTVHSLSPILGSDHQHISSLKSMITGDIPASSQDFDTEKNEKSRKYKS